MDSSPPLTASRCAKVGDVYNHLKQEEEDVGMKITTVGLDLVKNVFQVHGADELGRVCIATNFQISDGPTDRKGTQCVPCMATWLQFA